MTTLTPKETNMLRHALGLKGRNKVANRNYIFAAGWDAEVLQSLVEPGLVIVDDDLSTDMSRRFIVTRKGFEAVAGKGERLSPDIEKAMQEGYSTASSKVREMGFGAGMGLPNMKKNADVLEVSSKVGEGTRVIIIMNLNQSGDGH